MAKPKLASKTKTYNLLMPVSDWQVLAKISHEQSKVSSICRAVDKRCIQSSVL